MNNYLYPSLMLVSLTGYLVTAILYPVEVFAHKIRVDAWRRWILFISALTHLAGLLVFRSHAGHSLFSSPDGTALCFGWAVVVGLVFFERRSQRNIVGVFAMPIVFFVTLYAFGCPFAARHDSSQLQSYWLYLHVVIIIIGYVFLTMASFYALMYLIQERFLKHKRLTGVFRLLPSLQTADSVVCYLTASGLSLLTIGIITGVIRAHVEVPTYHPWHDQKILLSIVLWWFYATYFLTRRLLGWRGHKGSIVNIISFIVLLITFFSQHNITDSLPK